MRVLQVIKAALATVTPQAAVSLTGETDVPEVERIKRIVLPLLMLHWDVQARKAITDSVFALRDLEDGLMSAGVDAVVRASHTDQDRRDELLAVLILAFYQAIERRMWTPMEPEALAVVRSAILELLRQGGRSADATLEFGTPTAAPIPAMVESQLHLMMFGRLVTNRREVEQIFREALTSGALRREAAKEDGGKFGTRLEAALGIPAEDWAKPVGDAWAYETYTLGAVVALMDAGAGTIMAFNNPPHGPDARTTPFCFWVHGRVIAHADVVAKIAEVRSAIEAEDFEALKKARPLSSLPASAGATAYVQRFNRSKYPPYHWGCRTQVRRRASRADRA